MISVGCRVDDGVASTTEGPNLVGMARILELARLGKGPIGRRRGHKEAFLVRRVGSFIAKWS